MARRQYKYRKPPRKRIRFSRILLLLLLAGMVAWPFMEATLVTVENRTVQIPGLASNLRNLKVLFVSDIHQGRFFSQARVNQLIQKINSLGADIVILGGDYAEDAAGAVAFFQNAPRIQARFGVFGVLGRADRLRGEGEFSQLVAEMTNYGCLPLTNNVARVKVGQAYLSVAGVDDFSLDYANVQSVASQVSRSDFVIFVGHTPDLLPAAFAAKSAEGDTHWFDLALFGATHGGQVRVFNKPLIPGLLPSVGSRYLSGWREENRASILVSNGIGTSTLPIRLFTPPQIHLITLRSR